MTSFIEVLGLWLGILADGTWLVAGTVALVGGGWLYLQHRRGVFKHVLNSTLNVVEARDDGEYLCLRGLYQAKLPDVITHSGTVRKLKTAFEACTSANVFAFVTDGEARRRVIEDLTMFLSTYPGIEAKIANFLGRETLTGVVIVNVPTFEPQHDDRDRKGRVFAIERETLRRFLDRDWAEYLQVEVPHHRDRVQWLCAMAELYFHGTSRAIPVKDVPATANMIFEVRW